MIPARPDHEPAVLLSAHSSMHPKGRSFGGTIPCERWKRDENAANQDWNPKEIAVAKNRCDFLESAIRHFMLSYLIR